MAYSSLIKCTKAELSDFKSKVIAFLEIYGIDTARLDIRAFQQFGGDVRIYIDRYFELKNKRSSFRRSGMEKTGGLIVYEGTRGRHAVKYSEPITFNRDEWNEFLENKDGFWNFIYEDLDKLKKEKNG